MLRRSGCPRWMTRSSAGPGLLAVAPRSICCGCPAPTRPRGRTGGAGRRWSLCSPHGGCRCRWALCPSTTGEDRREYAPPDRADRGRQCAGGPSGASGRSDSLRRWYGGGVTGWRHGGESAAGRRQLTAGGLSPVAVGRGQDAAVHRGGAAVLDPEAAGRYAYSAASEYRIWVPAWWTEDKGRHVAAARDITRRQRDGDPAVNRRRPARRRLGVALTVVARRTVDQHGKQDETSRRFVGLRPPLQARGVDPSPAAGRRDASRSARPPRQREADTDGGTPACAYRETIANGWGYRPRSCTTRPERWPDSRAPSSGLQSLPGAGKGKPGCLETRARCRRSLTPSLFTQVGDTSWALWLGSS